MKSEKFLLKDKPLDYMTEEEYKKYYKESTGKEYIEPTEEERQKTLKEYERFMTDEQKRQYGLIK